MDPLTLEAYDAHAPRYCELYRSLEPAELYNQVRAFFHPGEPTADVGCGSGRDTAWLAGQGFPCTGYDCSPAMLREAKAAYPELNLQYACLPELNGVADESFSNVLCAATLMHIPRQHLITAVLALVRILRDGGRLIVTYRPSLSGDERDPDGRLYTAIPPGKLALLLEAGGLQVVQTIAQADTFRPDVTWTVLVAEKSRIHASRGLERVQTVLAQDKKDATYKYALLRALCRISRVEANTVRWGGGLVYVSLRSIAVQWLAYYWPFLARPGWIRQKRGEGPDSQKQLAFRPAVAGLANQFGTGGLYAVLRDLDEQPARYRFALKKIADTIRYGPVEYSGTTGERLFRYAPTAPAGVAAGPEGEFGWVAMPEPIWLDITRFAHWIEDSLIIRWAELTAEMNPGTEMSQFVPLLLNNVVDERDTTGVRDLLTSLGRPIECVWSGAAVGRSFEVDHVIPYSAWGNNDWWNLLPALPKLNNQKRDALPTRQLLLKRRDCIIDYWRVYRQYQQGHFERQVTRALGQVAGQADWELVAFAGLQEAVERVAATRGLARWEP